MSVVSTFSPNTFWLSQLDQEPSEWEKKSWETKRICDELKAKHEQFLRDRAEKERRLLYAIAEKLGIDTENI